MLKHLSAVLFIFGQLLSHEVSAESGSLPVIELSIANHTISAEVANTLSTRATGLMHRTYLPENSGMLFVFPVANIYSMWMQNTHIPLSVAFLDEAGVIINIADMVPNTLTSHRSAKAAKYALEMNAGWFDMRKVKPGDQVIGIGRSDDVQ